MIPQDVRIRWKLEPGAPLTLVETPQGLLLLTREQLKSLVRSDLAGASLVESLLADRARDVGHDDAD